MKIIGVAGLGADKRIFKYLNLDYEIQIINWIEVNEETDLNIYVKELSTQIKTEEEFVIIGVSFGGIVAIELSKILKPKLIILISSVSNNKDLPKHWIGLGEMGLLSFVPDKLMKPPQFIFNFLFSAQNTELLKKIIKDTDPAFIRWALRQIIFWRNEGTLSDMIRIHGTKDKMIPLIGDAIKIEGGGHFMIVDKAKEISLIINQQIRKQIAHKST